MVDGRRQTMKRRNLLTLSALAVAAAAATALPAAGAGSKITASAQKVFKSSGCGGNRVNSYTPATWACTTVTVTPWQIEAGGATTVAYSFKAKRKLKYVTVCFSRMLNLASCAYTHNFRVLKRGQVIKRMVQLATPPYSTPSTGVWLFDNTTHFYKDWSKPASRSDPYWAAHSYVRVLPTDCHAGQGAELCAGPVFRNDP
jgi:hypothetical protein